MVSNSYWHPSRLCLIAIAFLHLPRGGHGESSGDGGNRSGGSVTGFNKLKFADDFALIADEPAKLQSLIDSTEAESKQFGLTVRRRQRSNVYLPMLSSMKCCSLDDDAQRLVCFVEALSQVRSQIKKYVSSLAHN